MNRSAKGFFYGETNETIHLEGITLTDTVYTHDRVDWHYHEHAYFTFILSGAVIEGNKKEVYHCMPGSLLFHNWQEPHYNIKPAGFTRGFHLEIDHSWVEGLEVSYDRLQGSINIADPDVRFSMYKIFRTTKMDDQSRDIGIQTLLLEMLSRMDQREKTRLHKNPGWVSKLDEMLHEQLTEPLTLNYLANILNIHPVHLSRDFPKYFHCNLTAYIRKLRVEKALSLMASPGKSITEIAYECGFSDQSHLTRSFKEFNALLPSTHRKLFLKV